MSLIKTNGEIRTTKYEKGALLKMFSNIIKKTHLLLLVVICIVVGAVSFYFLILQQDNILRKYFILQPEERLKEFRISLANSLSKSFIRENRSSDLEEVTNYLKRYGRTSLYELSFIFQDKDGTLKQISQAGVAKVSTAALGGAHVYPATIEDGGKEGYLTITISQADSAELREGLSKYRMISYSLRLIFLLLVTAFLVILFYHDYSAKMRLARDIAEIRASNDGLTGLHTHEHFIKVLQVEVEKVRLYDMPLALLMLDIDYFKTFNDKFGHLAGDKVLEEVSKIIKLSTRATDILARYGGEEFAVIVPYVAKPGDIPGRRRLADFLREIRGVAERIRKNVEANEIYFTPDVLKVTVSIGVAFYYRRDRDMTAAALLEKADKALYQAKRSGRNRIQIDYERRGMSKTKYENDPR